MTKEMTRKEFMLTLGFGTAALFGFSTIANLFAGKHNPLQNPGNARTNGFGSGDYGNKSMHSLKSSRPS